MGAFSARKENHSRYSNDHPNIPRHNKKQNKILVICSYSPICIGISAKICSKRTGEPKLSESDGLYKGSLKCD
ncbi:hypothetical protein RvY_02601 [Ramazzottius varieornatus]|uniref:Uncharacterized protein n=1 Tax=Ramazzottius varieornatus TaxID=947166 RepID=A0A1D1USA8_RAMVA|nr:hypothetical protein RvY_02601 [Ramazzottius varieornatus]